MVLSPMMQSAIWPFFTTPPEKGYLLNAGSDDRINFTGQHRTFIKDVPFTQAEELKGLIVSADINKYIKMSGGIEAGSNAITVNESLPIVSISTKVKDKNVSVSSRHQKTQKNDRNSTVISYQIKIRNLETPASISTRSVKVPFG